MMVCRIQIRKNATERGRPIANLNKKGREKTVTALLFGVPKVKVKVRQSGLVHGFDVLDDR